MNDVLDILLGNLLVDACAALDEQRLDAFDAIVERAGEHRQELLDMVDVALSLRGPAEPSAAQVEALARHPEFTMKNPNRVRSLYMAFAGNPLGFHAPDGAGYRMIADVILALDPINPQTAARFVPSLGRWRRIEPVRAALMKAELERIAAAGKLSRDTFEQVSRSLDG